MVATSLATVGQYSSTLAAPQLPSGSSASETVPPLAGRQLPSPDNWSFETDTFVANRLQLEPADGSPEAKAHAVWKSHLLLSKLAAHKHYFTDYTRGCSGDCKGYCVNLTSGCQIVKHRVAAALLAKDALVWEVWRKPATSAAKSVDFAGILRLSEVEPGCTAKAHYMFFDGRLKEKTPLLLAWKDFVFSRLNLRRITIEVPENAFALARHAVRDLGFGGRYDYAGLPVEGVLTGAKVMDGKPLDIIVLGLCK